ncbi:hypothetical protein Tco_0086517 [Tanacetum coccineum]
MDHFQLCMKTFPLSLSRDARKWWMNEGDGKINTWEELVNKFFSKFYSLSYASNYVKMCDDDDKGRDPLEFRTWRNSEFKDHKKVDETTKRTLLHSWIEVGNNEGIMDEIISSDSDRDHTSSYLITKPELKISDEFLKILHDNSFNDAEKWLNSKGTATTWKELGDKFFHKYYPLSHTYKSKIPDDLDHGTDYFEFLYWLASKFDNYWELDKNIKTDYGSFM